MERTIVFVFFAILQPCGGESTKSSTITLSPQAKRQIQRLNFEKFKCISRIKEPIPGPGLYCNATFDNVMCWPHTPAGIVVKQPCPAYVDQFNSNEFAVKTCLKNGSWYFSEEHNRYWTDFKSCVQGTPTVDPLIKDNLEMIGLISRLGYSISLVVLLAAVGLMLSIKKLHCHRNRIHINLFLSFIIRAILCLLRDFLVQGAGLHTDVNHEKNGTVFIEESTHWECKLLFTLMQYALGANYMWIFIEGLYLHTLIFLAVFSQMKIYKWYIILGWLSPLTFVIPWVLVRIFLRNTLCWNTHEGGYYWIMEGPIIATICINFFFFINIIRVLFTKLMASNTRDPRRYRKLAKSTLVLIPLFGVHYIIFIIIPDNLEPKLELIKFYTETVLNSFQGVVVALLFCFLNGEVRSEIKRLWKRHRLRRSSASTTRSSRAFSTTSFLMRSRGSTCPPVSMSEITRRESLSSSVFVTNGDVHCSSNQQIDESVSTNGSVHRNNSSHYLSLGNGQNNALTRLSEELEERSDEKNEEQIPMLR